MGSRQKIIKVWEIPPGNGNIFDSPVYFHLSEDKKWWTGMWRKKQGEHDFICRIDKRHGGEGWDFIRLYAIEHLLPELEPPTQPESYFRFKDLDL